MPRPPSRRDFLGGIVATTALVAGSVVPASRAETPEAATAAARARLTVLNDRPLNAETPLALLDAHRTANNDHFIRNNGLVPESAWAENADAWRLLVDGAVRTPLELSLADLQSRFPRHRAGIVLECGGNGRAGFQPPARGNQWTLGAVGCADYEGVLLRDVLAAAGVRESAVYLAWEGADTHLSGAADKRPISRGCPIAKALDGHSMLAWSMNDAPLPPLHGFPVRLMVPGFPASASGKWLRRLWVREQVHDGAKMTGLAYRMPRHPVAPGSEVSEDEMEIIETMPVKSLVTSPLTGHVTPANAALPVRGHAWSGHGDIVALHVSLDFGATWVPTSLDAPANRWAWQDWRAELRFPTPGHYEVWIRATDETGAMQPMVVPGWNPKGYLNNAMQRIAVRVT